MVRRKDAPAGTLYGDWDRPIVVVLHGLESRSDAPFTRRMAAAFQRRGWDCAVVNFRSCASDADVPLQPGGYHIGFTQVRDCWHEA